MSLQEGSGFRVADEDFLHLLNFIEEGVFCIDLTGTCIFCNASCLRLLGYTDRHMLLGMNMHQLIHRSRADRSLLPEENCQLFRALQNGVGAHADDEVFRRADGTVFPAEYRSYPLTGTGGVAGAIVTFLDITGRSAGDEAPERADDRLKDASAGTVRESKQLFMDIIRFLPDPTFVIDSDGKVLAWNRTLEEFSGIHGRDIIGKGNYEYGLWMFGKRRPALVDLILDPDKDSARLNYTDIRREGQTVTAQTTLRRSQDGKMIPFSLVASPLRDAQGKMAGAILSMRDISRLKEAESELARFNENLDTIIRQRTQALNDEIVQRKYAEQEVQDTLSYTRSVIEANPDLMVVLDREGTVLDVNTAAEMLTGYPREKLIGTPYSRYISDRTPPDILSSLFHKGKVQYTLQIRRADGHLTPLSVSSTVFRRKDAADVRIIVAGHDITREKQDEEALRASLDEQVLLLREVHHRVKNNLQIIISLTNLQMRQTDDPRIRQVMSETQNRVRAMSIVHEKLYRSQSLSHIDFADYSRYLATQLVSFFGMDTRRVRLEFAMGQIMVGIVTAVPLGLLMNELISNALKHAFPEERKGTITIGGGCEGGTITIIVRDDGIGIPEDMDWQHTSSLGMRLITSLVDQVDGTITLDRTQGTAFTIMLKNNPPPGGEA